MSPFGNGWLLFLFLILMLVSTSIGSLLFWYICIIPLSPSIITWIGIKPSIIVLIAIMVLVAITILGVIFILGIIIILRRISIIVLIIGILSIMIFVNVVGSVQAQLIALILTIRSDQIWFVLGSMVIIITALSLSG